MQIIKNITMTSGQSYAFLNINNISALANIMLKMGQYWFTLFTLQQFYSVPHPTTFGNRHRKSITIVSVSTFSSI